MIKNKHISKITMLTCLMLVGLVNAQEFYTCVPKKSWWSDTMSNSVAKGIAEDRKNTEKERCLKEKKKCEEKNVNIDNCFRDCFDDCMYSDEDGIPNLGHERRCYKSCKARCGFPSDCGTCP